MLTTVLRHRGKRVTQSSCYLTTGRSCLSVLVERYKPDRAFLPMVLPAGVNDPFEQADVPISRYEIRDDLSPDVGHLQALMDGAKTARPVVVGIHYCGYDIPMHDLASLARQAGGLFVEDCAHALVGPASQGKHGDVVLLSFNKTLPTVDGAIMLSRRADVNVTVETQMTAMPEVEAAYLSHLDAVAQACMAQGVKAQLELLAKANKFYDDYYALIVREMKRPRAGSPDSWAAYSQLDRDAAFKYFQTNASAWPAGLIECLYRGDTPAFALPVNAGLNRDRAFVRLLEIGVLSASWSDKWLPATIPDGPGDRFMRQHLLIPLGLGMSPALMEQVAGIVAGVKRESER